MSSPSVPLANTSSRYIFRDLITDPYAYLIVIAILFCIPLVVVIFMQALRLYCHNENRKEAARQRKLLLNEESMRQRVRTYLFVNTRLGIYWELFQTFLAFMSCVAYIISTYYEDCVVIDSWLDQWLEVTFVFFFLIDYMLNFYLARARISWFFSPVALADLLTIVPTILQLIVAISYGPLLLPSTRIPPSFSPSTHSHLRTHTYTPAYILPHPPPSHQPICPPTCMPHCITNTPTSPQARRSQTRLAVAVTLSSSNLCVSCAFYASCAPFGCSAFLA